MSAVEVTPAEAALLRIARAAVGSSPPRSAIHELVTPHDLDGVSPGALAALSETLSKGLIAALVRGGGWRARARGRLWERHAPPSLAVGSASLDALRVLAAAPLAESDALPAPPDCAVSLGDELVLYLLADLLVSCDLAHVLTRERARFGASTLVRVAFPLELRAPLDEPAAWLVPPRLVLLEGLETSLARNAVRAERARRALRSAAERAAATHAIAIAPGALVQAAIGAGRARAAGFWLEAAAELIVRRPEPPARWLSGDGAGLAPDERSLAARDAASFVAQTLAFEHAAHLARDVRHFDDGFTEAQDTLAWLEPWERGGFASARQLARRLSETSG